MPDCGKSTRKCSLPFNTRLPVLRDGLPASVDFDRVKEAVAKVQDAMAEGERDP
jgi:hypothetical protein